MKKMRPAIMAAAALAASILTFGSALAQAPTPGKPVRNTLGTLVVNRTGATLANLPDLSRRDEESRRAAAAAFSADMTTLRDAAGIQGGNAAAFNGPSGSNPIGIWVGGAYTYYDSDINSVFSNGDIGLAQVGVDMRVNDWLLVGVTVMGDMLSGEVTSAQLAGVRIDTDAIGFMAGPYVVVRLADNTQFEALVAGGSVLNEYTMHPANISADYRSDRMLATAQLSTQLRQDDWSIIPSARFTWYSEHQHKFTDSNNTQFGEDDSSIGQARLGLEVGHDWALDEGGIRPFVGVEGAWAVQQSGQIMNNRLVTPEELSASANLGVDANFGPWTLRATGQVDGLGNAEFDSYGGNLQVRMAFE